MDKEQNTVFKLLRNEHFVRWVQNPTDDSNHYWIKWMTNHESRSRDVEIARKVIQSGSLVQNTALPEERYSTMLENIMDYASQKQKGNSISHFRIWRYVAVAASVVLLISAVFLVDLGWDSKMEEEKTVFLIKEAPYGNKLTTRLPDGTTVTLNSGSTISYPEKFDTNTRKVNLIGEAFFEVEHNPDKPFLVRFRDQEVKVLGTSFNIRTYDVEDYSEVAVATGRVAYSSHAGNDIILLPLEKACLKTGSSNFNKGKVNKLADFGWRDRMLYFESNSFEEIKIELERWYGVEIESEGFKPSGTYTGKFDNATLKEVLNGLSFMYRFDFTIEGSKVTIIK